MKISCVIFSLFLIGLFTLAGCKKSAETEGIQALCPIVVSTDPMKNAVDIAYEQVIQISFNTEMDSNSINTASVLIQDVDLGTMLAGRINTTDNPSVYVFTPELPLLPFNEYTLIVKKAATSQFRLAMEADYSTIFTTIPLLKLYTSSLESGAVAGGGDYAQGASVAISAIPTAGHVFINWTETGTSTIVSTSPNFLYRLDGNHSLTGNFGPVVLGNFSVNLSSNPANGGTTSGAGAYEEGSTVPIQATPNTNFSFANWTKDGNIVSLNPSFTIPSILSNNILVANFTANPLALIMLTLSSNPNAGGSASGGGNYIAGTSVNIIANPFIGYHFINWTDQFTGAVVSTSANYKFVLNTNKHIVANYSINQYALTTTAINGSITKNPDQANYNHGTIVQLTAVPNAEYSFTGWSGDTTAISNPLSLKMVSKKSITANFIAIPKSTYTLSIVSNHGTVTKNPNQPSYTSGTTVQLTAAPIAGYVFIGWTGDTITTNNPISIGMTKNKTITANFTAIPLITYTLNTTGTNGIVTKNPNQPSYDSGASVQLTATPNTGYTFGSWTGDGTGNTNPLSVTMNANKNIAANFTIIPVIIPDPIPPAVALGSIANFGAYGGNAGITNQGVHTVINNGAIGTTAAPTLITGFHDGITGATYTETPLNIGNVTQGIFTAPPAPGTAASFTTATNALSDANTAYLSMSPASRPGGTDPGAGELGGLTLAPGIYRSSIATFKITNQNLILDGQGNPDAFWIFQMSAGLTVGTPAGARSVTLIGGAQAKNVFWYVGSAAVINYAGGGTMVGTIIATAGVTLSSPANSTTTSAQTILNGRAISLVASVTMVNTIVNNQ